MVDLAPARLVSDALRTMSQPFIRYLTPSAPASFNAGPQSRYTRAGQSPR
jgi:hypothetical protein